MKYAVFWSLAERFRIGPGHVAYGADGRVVALRGPRYDERFDAAAPAWAGAWLDGLL